MDWTKSLREAIEYMEEHILEPITPGDVAKFVNISVFYMQKGFQIVTGYSLSEYIKCRRLYLAALDLSDKDEKVIEIAYKYCYQTPESFTKAFTRFHGFTPSQVKMHKGSIRSFMPLRIKISVQGGLNMNFNVEKMENLRLIGFKKKIPMENGFELCPKFWDKIKAEYLVFLCKGKKPENDIEHAIVECNIGMYGVCIESEDDTGSFNYYIAGNYDGRPVPEGLEVVEIPEATWAKFKAIGPLPSSLQSLNSRIFGEWLPGNKEYDLAFPTNIEYYSAEENSPNCESGIWLPVIKKD